MKIVANNQLPHPSYLLLLLFQFFSLCVFYIRTYMCSSSGCAKSKAMFYYSFAFLSSLSHIQLFFPRIDQKKKNEMNVKCKNHIKTTCYMFVCGFFLQPFVSRMIFLFPFLSVFISVFLLFLLSFFHIYFCDIVAFTYYGFMRIIRTIRGTTK